MEVAASCKLQTLRTIHVLQALSKSIKRYTSFLCRILPGLAKLVAIRDRLAESWAEASTVFKNTNLITRLEQALSYP